MRQSRTDHEQNPDDASSWVPFAASGNSWPFSCTLESVSLNRIPAASLSQLADRFINQLKDVICNHRAHMEKS
jgi:hypothetical protein